MRRAGDVVKRLAPFLVMLAGCLWATLGLFVRHFNDVGLTSMEILEARNILSAAALFLFLGLFRRELLRVRAKDLWCFAGGGIGSVILFNYCYFQTIQRSSLSVAAILLYTSPIFVLLLSVPLFGEKLTKKKVFCLIMAFTGCALAGGVASDGMNLSWVTLLLGLGSGFGYGLYSIFSRYALQRGYHPMSITAYILLFASVGGIPLTDFSQLSGAVQRDGGLLWYLMVFTLVATILPNAFYITGLRYVENGVAAVLACIEPAMATIFGFFVFSEMPTPAGWAGIFLVLAALVLLNLQPKKPDDTK